MTSQVRNMEIPLGDRGDYFPRMIPLDKVDVIKEKLASFCHRFGFERMIFVQKLEAIKLYKKGRHVDWIGLNEVIKHYKLKIPFAPKTSSKRLYTSPEQRAYRL